MAGGPSAATPRPPPPRPPRPRLPGGSLSARASPCSVPAASLSARAGQNAIPALRQQVPSVLSRLSSSGRQPCGTEAFPESLESLLFGGASSAAAPLSRSKGDLSAGDAVIPGLLPGPTTASKSAAWEAPDSVDPGRPYSLSLRLGAGFGGLLRDVLSESDDDDDDDDDDGSPTSMSGLSAPSAEASQTQLSTEAPATCRGETSSD